MCFLNCFAFEFHLNLLFNCGKIFVLLGTHTEFILHLQYALN